MKPGRGWRLGVLAAASLVQSVPGSAQAGQGGGIALGAGQLVRGTVTQATGTQATGTGATAGRLSVKTASGEVYQVVLSANTRLMKDRQPLRASEVHRGDGVGAMGEVEAATKTVHALFVVVIDRAQMKQAQAAMGKTWIAGTVTAVDGWKWTVLREDGVSQVVRLTSATVIRRGGQGMQRLFAGEGMGGPGQSGPPPTGGVPETAAGAAERMRPTEVRIGDRVAGRGALQHGVFAASTLEVLHAAAGENGRRGKEAGAGVSAP